MRPGTLLRWHVLKNIFRKEIQENAVVFDIGGFDGFISDKLRIMFPNIIITVIDIDENGLRLAKEKGLNTTCAPASKLPIGENMADIVLCLDLLEHVKEDAEVITEISRVLKKNGKLILTTPMQKGVSFPLISRKKSALITEDWGHVRKGYSIEELEDLFKSNNLKIVGKSRYFNFLSRLAYRMFFLSPLSLKGNGLLWRGVIRLESWVRCREQEHIIIGIKGKL